MVARMVDVGGHRLSARIAGSGGPTVVFESHLGGGMWVWKKVWREVASVTTVCLYDRAGLGRSESGPAPRTVSRASHDLYRLVKRLALPPPLVLVGHSFGGLIVQAFARRHANLIGGIVLVDSSHPDQRRRLENLLIRASRAEFDQFRRSSNAESVNLGRLSTRSVGSRRFPHVPLRVLSADPPAESLKPFADQRAASRVMRSMEVELSNLSPRGRLVRVTRSGHFIQLDRPEVVIRHVCSVVNDVRHPSA